MEVEGARVGPWDHVATQLQEWRRSADEPSYAEIALRISRRRQAEGMDPAAARVGRTTVYDAFRLGRARVNLGLVREIADALGVAREVVDELVRTRHSGVASPAPQQQVPAEPDAEPGAEPGAEPDRGPRPRSTALLMLGCVLVNLLGREFVNAIGLPVYLDMVGTAVAAIALGPWRGAAVGLLTNTLGVVSGGSASLAFSLVNVVGALVWGYGIHRYDLGRTLVRFLALTLAVAAACTLVAVPLLLWLYGGSVGHDQDSLTAKLFALMHHQVAALWMSNLMTSVADKLMCAFVALTAVSALGHPLPASAPSPLGDRHAHRLSRGLGPSRPCARTP